MVSLKNYPITMVKVLLNRIRKTREEFERLLKREPLAALTPKRILRLDKNLRDVFRRAEELEKQVARTEKKKGGDGQAKRKMEYQQDGEL